MPKRSGADATSASANRAERRHPEFVAERHAAALNPTQAARYLGISRTRLFQLLRDGAIDSVKLGWRTRLIPVANLDAWLAAQHSGKRVAS